MNHWKKIDLSLRSLETGNLSADNFKNTRTRWVDTWARGTVWWYWSADTLFWQLSVDHNIDVQLVSSRSPKLARKCESKTLVSLWCGRTVARSLDRSVYGHVISRDLREHSLTSSHWNIFPAVIDCITYPFTLFDINFACCHIQKLKIALLSWAKNEW